MFQNTHKKRIAVIILLVIVIGLISFFIIKRNKNISPTYEQKVKMIKEVNEDAAKAPQIPLKEKEEIIQKMNETTKEITPDEKKSLLEKYN